MATAIDAENSSDEYKDAKCCICANENKDEVADYFCYDCNKHLCTSCLGIHNKFNATHNVVQGLGDGKDVLTEKCGKHADELITLYCRQHDKLLCRKCRLLDHRKCQGPQNIRECSDELNADPELQAVPVQLNSAMNNINKAIEALDRLVAGIQQSGNCFLKDLEDYAKKLLSRIKELREKSKKDIKSKQEELLSVAKQHRQACALTKDEIHQCLVKITKSNMWKANMFVLKKKGQTIAQKVDTLYNESDCLIKGCQFNVITDKKIFDSINCFKSLIEEHGTTVHDTSSDCTVKGGAVRPVQATERRQTDKQGDMPVVRLGQKPSVEKALYNKQVKNICIRMREDVKACNSFGCCFMNDGSLMIVDCSNKSPKRLDPSTRKLTKYCDIYGQPTDVCCIGPQLVAVAFGSTHVQVYNTDSRTRTRTVELGHRTDCIACHGGLLYCAELWGHIVYVHDVSSGRKLREISMDTDGRELFSNISHIAVNSSGDRLYVADGRRGLVCVGVDGRPIFHLSHQDLGLTGAFGVTTDHRGHVYVCGWNSYNVVMVTEDGHVVGQILSEEDGITWRPRCLSYDVNRSRLCVGGDSDQLLMVEL